MVSSHFLILLLFQLSFASTEWNYKGCGKTWLCLVNGDCVDIQLGKKLVMKKDSKPEPQHCKVFVRIRKLQKKDLVILKYRGGDVKEVTLSVKQTTFDDRFGCKKNGDLIQPVVSVNDMEMDKSVSIFDGEIFTCAGYILQHLTVDDVGKFKLTVITTETLEFEGVSSSEAISMDSFKSCDSLMVNAKWDLNKIEKGFLTPRKMDVPGDNNLPDCSIGSAKIWGLYYKKFLDSPAQPVDHFRCSSNQLYELKFKDEVIDSPVHPFILFCAENVNTKCIAPTPLGCDNCTGVPFNVGKTHTPAELKCDRKGYIVESGETSYRVAGDPICQGNPSNPTEPVWTIVSDEGQLLVFSRAACHPELTCFADKPLHSECSDGENECTQGMALHGGVICPKGTIVAYDNANNELIRTGEKKVSCNPSTRLWIPTLNNVKNVKCYYVENNEEASNNLLSEKTLKTIGIGVAAVLGLVCTIVLFFCLFNRCRRDENALNTEIAEGEKMALKEEENAAMESKKTEKSKKMEDSKKLEDSTIPDYTQDPEDMSDDTESVTYTRPKDGLAERKERYPFIDVNLLTRADESTPLLFHNLVRARSDYICEALISEWEQYSVFERIKFAERIVYDLGSRTVMVRYIDFFLDILKKEEEVAVWDNMISGIKIMILALKRERIGKAKKKNRSLMIDKLYLIILQFGKIFLTKHSFYPGPNDDEKILELRSLAYYAFTFSNGTEIIEKFSQMFLTMKDAIPPPLRAIVWASVVRNEDKFDEVKEIFTNELAHPSRNDDTRWGTKREHLIYALCATKNRDLCEPFLNTIIKEPQYTKSEVVAGFNSMVRDFDECHDGAKFLFSERHNMIKAKLPVETDEYKKIFRMFFQFASISMACDEWLAKFIAAEETFDPLERKEMEFELSEAIHFGELHKNLPARCHHRKRGYHLKTYLKTIEKTAQFNV